MTLCPVILSLATNMQMGTYIIHDGKLPFYVGKGNEKRAHSHLKTSHSTMVNRKIAKMRREGREPVVQFIPAPDDEHAKEMECLLIAMIGRRDLGLGPLLNGTDGGDGLSNPSFETRAKMAAAKKDIPRPDIAASRRGKTYPALSAAKSGKPNPAQSERMKGRPAKNRKMCTVDGVMFYPSLRALVNELGAGVGGRRHPNFRYLEK